MTITKNYQTPQRGVAIAVLLASLAGCSAVGSVAQGNKVDYKSASKKSSQRLDVPPDLTQLQRENRYAVPDASHGSVTASAYSQQQQGMRPAAAGATVAVNAMPEMRIERAGDQRWLVVNRAPEALWPEIKRFWEDAGFTIAVDAPQIGVIETDWAENRAKIPQDFIRRTIGKVFDSLYSTGERDKFRTRLERAPNGATEIYISHRGVEEVLVGQHKDQSKWTSRPSDPELEAEFLSRLMTHLVPEGARTKTVVANETPAQPQRARLVKSANAPYVQVDESFDRAWRRVGLALDRVGFTVEDRDRSQGLYYVRYVDQDAQNASEKRFFSKLFSGADGDKGAKAAQRYRIAIKGSGDVSQVSVLNNDGQAAPPQTAEKILALLNDQLK